MRFIHYACLLLALFSAPATFAQEAPLVQTRLLADPAHMEDGRFWAGVEFKIPEGWHIYWENPGDSGMPTTIRWQLPEGMEAGAIHWPLPERHSMGGLTNYGYDGLVVLPVPIRPAEATPKGALHAKVDWLVCKDICIPQSAELRYDLATPAPAADRQSIKGALFNVPAAFTGKAYVVAGPKEVTLALAIEDADDEAAIFPIDDGWFSNSALPRVEIRKGWQVLHLKRASGEIAEQFHGVLCTQSHGEDVLYRFTATRVDALPPEVPAATAAPDAGGLPLAILFAFLGGLVLNLMPCVLPILALKALTLARKADASRAEAARHGLAYSAGVLCSFALIGGALLVLRAGGEAVGWGFQLQSPAFVLALTVMVGFVAFNLLGLYEFPVLFGTRGGQPGAKETVAGSVATGALAVALATPCTAPFMASALGVALTLSAAQAMLVFLALGAGMATPYLLISLCPRARTWLPKPGPWMQRFRELLAFPMLASCAWLLWVLSEQTGGAGLLQGFAVLLLVALALWGLKRNHRRFWRVCWWGVMLAALVWAVLVPPAIEGDNSAPAAMRHEPFSPERLAALQQEGVPVFVDATAAWCITCKLNERSTLAHPDTQALFHARGITLLVADWTKRDGAITAWLASFRRSGVPLYVYYPAQGAPRVLPQLLTPGIVAAAIDGDR